MKKSFKLPLIWKIITYSCWINLKLRWYTFWKNWHHVKFYYYNSSRHLLKTRKYHRRFRKAWHQVELWNQEKI
ncbi:hypothetical protein BKP45_01245 [Anaerobacillus alkalidiazotrophicus]|uniref:Uncharacterized protein n=1 Tax=Anaerobacillus alkalidiazotrophicus TaxID=472963 RepID=A0A1S2M9T4_9BACI|nr:hypothetical protein BKP45_01245 [Anaerobacillus alkalidiazotrophicus]